MYIFEKLRTGLEQIRSGDGLDKDLLGKPVQIEGPGAEHSLNVLEKT